MQTKLKIVEVPSSDYRETFKSTFWIGRNGSAFYSQQMAGVVHRFSETLAPTRTQVD